MVVETAPSQLESSQILPTTHQDSEPAPAAEGHKETTDSSSASAVAHTRTVENTESSQILPTTHQDSDHAPTTEGHKETTDSSSASAVAHTRTVENTESSQILPTTHQDSDHAPTTEGHKETTDSSSASALAHTLKVDNTESSQILPSTLQDSDPAHIAEGLKETTNSSSASAVAHTLTEDNTHKVFEMMYEAREKWQSIGGIFLISQSTLDNIESDNKNNDDKLRKVIIEWLRKYGGTENCTWAHVAMALRNKTVAREDLAQEVFEQYPQSLSVPPPSLHSSHTSPDSASGATAVVKHSGSHPPAGNVK